MFRFYISIQEKKVSMPNEWISAHNAQIPEKHKLKFRNEKAFFSYHAYLYSHARIIRYDSIYYNFFISLSAFPSVLFGTANDTVHKSFRRTGHTVIKPMLRLNKCSIVHQQQSAIRRSAVKAEDC